MLLAQQVGSEHSLQLLGQALHVGQHVVERVLLDPVHGAVHSHHVGRRRGRQLGLVRRTDDGAPRRQPICQLHIRHQVQRRTGTQCTSQGTAHHLVVTHRIAVVQHAASRSQGARGHERFALLTPVVDVRVLGGGLHRVLLSQHLRRVGYPCQHSVVHTVGYTPLDPLRGGRLTHREHRHTVADVHLHRITHALG